jgi:hypothetical protein
MTDVEIAPTGDGNLAIKTVALFVEYEILVCAPRFGDANKLPRVGTVVDVAESMYKVCPPETPLLPAGPVGPAGPT